MRIVEEFDAKGHPNVRAAHPTTIEITTEQFVTLRGDCIVLVASSKAAKDLSEDFKKLAKRPEAKIRLTLTVDNVMFSVNGRGSPLLTFMGSKDMVVRKSSFVSDRTIMISADKASIDIPRILVEWLKNPNTHASVMLEAEV